MSCSGWLTFTSWQASVSGAGFLAGTIIQALFTLNIAGYTPQRWHGTLLAIMCNFVGILFNTVFARKLPLVEGILVFCHVLGVVIVIPLLVLSPRRTGSGPAIEFWNPNGWNSAGTASMIGMLSTIVSLIGFDCSIHMCKLVFGYCFGILADTSCS